MTLYEQQSLSTLVCYEKFERIETSQFRCRCFTKHDFYRESIEIFLFNHCTAHLCRWLGHALLHGVGHHAVAHGH